MADLSLTSTAFRSGDTIPDGYSCSGDDVSPQLEWRNLPQGTRSLTLIMDDPDAPGGLFVHWVLYNIPPSITELPENYQPPEGVASGRTSFGPSEYGGPCPPLGETHRYYFRLYAVDTTLDLTAGATRAQVIDAMHGHILAETELMGRFGR